MPDVNGDEHRDETLHVEEGSQPLEVLDHYDDEGLYKFATQDIFVLKLKIS